VIWWQNTQRDSQDLFNPSISNNCNKTNTEPSQALNNAKDIANYQDEQLELSTRIIHIYQIPG
jgi:hypothetical protein